MGTTFSPLYDRVVIKRIEQQEKTPSGVLLPPDSKEKPVEGEVIATGEGKLLADGSLRKLTVKVGDRVLFSKYGGTEVKVDGEDRLVIKEDEILGVLGTQ